MKHEKPNKIYWYCFKRQLEELYYLLYSEKCISCGIDEFISHFTGKKFRIDNQYTGKLEWNADANLLQIVLDHLLRKKFIEDSGVVKHFNCTIGSGRNEGTTGGKQIMGKLDNLFPEETGYRCKQRLYYKQRNKENVYNVLSRIGVLNATKGIASHG